MRAWVRSHRHFVAFSSSTFALLVVLVVFYALAGERVIAAAYAGRSIAILNRYCAPSGGESLGTILHRTQGDLHTVLMIALALWILGAIVYLVSIRRGGWRWLPVAILGWWIGVETIVSPRLDFPLWNTLYRLVQDPDHRPKETDGRFNSDSLRDTLESSEFHPADLNLLFLGDSFTFGAGVGPTEAFPQVARLKLLERFPQARIHVANFGWISSSPLLALRRLIEIGERYAPDIVLMCVDMTDFHDDLRGAHILARDGLYKLYDKLPLTLRVWQTIAPESFRRTLSWSVGGMPTRRFFITDGPIEENRHWIEPLVHNVESIAAWCRARDIEFVLVILPRSYQYSDREVPDNWERDEYVPLGEYAHEPFRFFNHYAETAPFLVVSLLSDFYENKIFPTCFEDDPHWNPAGHQIAGSAIAREIEAMVARRLGK